MSPAFFDSPSSIKAETLFSKYDHNADGVIDLNEFENIMSEAYQGK
jgi:Ca2+-binding EF-hand superfamily protein